MVTLHQQVNVRKNRSTGEDIKIFRFFQMAAVRQLDLIGANLDHQWRVLCGLSLCKFGNSRYSSFKNMEVSIFGMNDWKTPIHELNTGVLGLFNPINGVVTVVNLSAIAETCSRCGIRIWALHWLQNVSARF